MSMSHDHIIATYTPPVNSTTEYVLLTPDELRDRRGAYVEAEYQLDRATERRAVSPAAHMAYLAAWDAHEAAYAAYFGYLCWLHARSTEPEF